MAAKQKDTEKPPVAVLTIHGAAGMDEAQRAQVVRWLRDRADDLAKNGGAYSPRFVARRFQ